MMVLDYAENGSLRNYLDKEYDELSWKIKFNNLWYIVTGLKKIPRFTYWQYIKLSCYYDNRYGIM